MPHIAAGEFSRQLATRPPLFCSEWSPCSALVRIHGSENLIQLDGGETRGVVGQAIRDDQLALVEERAARVNDVRHITFSFVLVGLEQGLAKTADNLAGIVA